MSTIDHRASAKRPCAVCESGTKGCSVTEDGMYLCRGCDFPPEGWVDLLHGHEDSQGFHHYRRRNDDRSPTATFRPAPTKPKNPVKQFTSVEKGDQLDDKQRQALADDLRLPVDATHAISFGWNGRGWTFPELTGAGELCGIAIRLPGGAKRQVTGGQRGLVTFVGWDEKSGPIFVTEGMSDGLALSYAGLACIARANAADGAEHLPAFLAQVPAGRDVVFLADGDEVGIDGAKEVGAKLAARFPNKFSFVIPPDGAKDAREYITRPEWGETPWPERGAALLRHVEATAVVLSPSAWFDADALPAFGKSANPTNGDGPGSSAPQEPTPERPVSDIATQAKKYAAAFKPAARRKIAGEFGWPEDAFDALPLVGLKKDGKHTCLTFPECDAHGLLSGLVRVWAAGQGKEYDGRRQDEAAVKGSERGATLPDGWRERGGPFHFVRGPVNTLALYAAGTCAVGRPFADGKADQLAQLLHEVDSEGLRDVIVWATFDADGTGTIPGHIAAEKLARRLKKGRAGRVLVALPPGEAKDVHDWLTAPERGDTPFAERGAELELHACENGTEATATADLPDSPLEHPDDPHRLASGYLLSIDPPGKPRTLRFQSGEFLEWVAGAYRPLTGDEVKARLTEWVRADFEEVWKWEWEAWNDDPNHDPDKEPRVRKISVRLLGDVINVLKSLVILSAETTPPCWLDGEDGPDPRNVVAFPNGLLDIPSGKLIPPTPHFFTTNAVTFEYDPDPPIPERWIAFLEEVWPDDPEAVQCLREWLAYLLTADTSLQKLLMLIGPRRAGKGLILRIVRALVGARNYASPTLNSLAGDFGLSQLLHKTVAAIPDARFTGRSDDAGVVVERLLSITGEDTLGVNRKHKDFLPARLLTRFVIATNELPRLGDASGALSGRMIILRFTHTFFHREDHGLEAKLLAELPGILVWALAGWQTLRDRGRHLEPASGRELQEDMDDLSSPTGAFIKDRCVLGPTGSESVGNLFAAWKSWCDTQGREHPGTKQTFCRDLHASVGSLKAKKRNRGGERWTDYEGIRLRRHDEPYPQSPPTIADQSVGCTPEAPKGRDGPRWSADFPFARVASSSPGQTSRDTDVRAQTCSPSVVDAKRKSADHRGPSTPRSRLRNSDDPPAEEAFPFGANAPAGQLFDNAHQRPPD